MRVIKNEGSIGGASSAMKQFGATAMKAAHVYQTKGEGGAVSRVLCLSLQCSSHTNADIEPLLL